MSRVSPVAASSPPGASPVFATVFALLRPHFAALDEFLKLQLASFEPEIRDLAAYCLDTSGKRIRPALVFLSGWRAGEEPVADLVKAAAVVELVHLATLVHDDIMDGAELRRNRRTVAREYGATTAVLLGDALFSHALHLAAQYPTPEICDLVAASTRKVCAGEIMQTMRRRSVHVSREDYWRMIDLKTAELFRASCLLGAKLAGSPPEGVGAIARFGRHLGIAYQMYDDLADFFGDAARVGKTLGTDFASGKLTLPLLVLMEKLPESERASLTAELTGQRPGGVERRFQQMTQYGVFPAVVAAVQHELEVARSILGAWAGEATTPMLLQLCDTLRDQCLSLQPAATGMAQASPHAAR